MSDTDELPPKPEMPPTPEGMTRREWFETDEGQAYQVKRRAWKMAWKKTRKRGIKTTRKRVAKKRPRKARKRLVEPTKPDEMTQQEWEESPRYQKYLDAKDAWEAKLRAMDEEEASSKKKKPAMKKDVLDEEEFD